MKIFFKEHFSIFFIGTLITLGLAGTVLGIVWTYSPPTGGTIPWQQPVGSFLAQFCGSLLAIGLTGVFISLPDLRNYLSATVAQVLSGDQALTLLSAATKRNLYQRLFAERLADRVHGVEPSLYEHVSRRNDEILTSVYVTNFVADTAISLISNKPGFVICRTSMSYRLHAQHLPGGANINLVYEQSANYPDPLPFEEADWMRECAIKAGSSVWNKSAVVCSRKKLDKSTSVMRALFTHSITVSTEIDVSITAEFLSTSADPLDITRARYPSQGLRATLTFTDDYTYECSWFKLCKPPYVSHDNINTESLPNGIRSFTNDWLLPGEGVLLNFSKKIN